MISNTTRNRYDKEVLSEIFSVKKNWTICDVYHVNDNPDGETIGMEIKYYEKDAKYSVLMGGRFHIMKEEYFEHSRRRKLKKIIEKLNNMIHDLKETEQSRNILRIESAYASSVHKLDVHNCIIVKNDKGVITDSLSIDQAIAKFYESKSVQCFGIDRAFVFNLDTHTIINNITNLPDTEKKEMMKARKAEVIISEIARLNNELQNL